MQVVAGIELRQEVIGICWIAHNLVEIDHRIKVARCPNPLVDHLAVGLSCRSRKIKTRAHERQDRTACHPYAVGASTLDDLLVRAEDVIDQLLVFGRRGLSASAQHTDIINTLQNDQGTYSGLRYYVVVKARQRIGSQAVQQKAITANPLIQYRDRSTLRDRLQSPGKKVWPAIVPVGCGTVPVGD